MKIWRTGMMLIVLLVFVGCAPKHYTLRVSGLARDGPDESARPRFALRPADPSVRPDDLLFAEFARLVALGLGELGYEEARGDDSPGLMVYLGYGVSEPMVRQYIESYPAYPSHYVHVRPGHDPDQGSIHHHYYSYDERIVRTRYETLFDSLLAIDVVSLESGAEGEGPQLWSLRASVRTRSDDVRHLMAYLVAGSIDHWGADTRRTIELRVARDDPRVARLRAREAGWNVSAEVEELDQ